MSRASSVKKAKPATAEPSVSIRDRLIAATLELAQTMSLHEMSQARVAAAAGVRQSHLTYYFPARVDLVKATVLAIRDQMLQTTSLITAMDGNSAQAVDAVRNYFSTNVRDLPKARMMLSLMLAADEDPSLREWLEELDRESIGQLQQVLLMLGFEADIVDVELFQITLVGAILHGTQIGTESALQRASKITTLAFDRLIQSSKRV